MPAEEGIWLRTVKVSGNGTSETLAPGDFANNIRNLVLAYQIFREEKCLIKAEEFVKHAVLKMFDDYSPLARNNTTDTLYAGNGTAFVNFYHAPGGSDDLMWALALYAQEVGRTLEDIKPDTDAGEN